MGGDKKLSAVINGSIKNMEKAILAATNANQKLMKLSIKAFKKCKTKMWRNYGRALPYEKRYWQLKTIYPKCIKAERYWNLQRIKVWKIYKKARNMYINYKKLHKIAGNKCVNVSGFFIYIKKPETCTSITKNSTRLQETSASMFLAFLYI